jgi:hypothetical protein
MTLPAVPPLPSFVRSSQPPADSFVSVSGDGNQPYSDNRLQSGTQRNRSANSSALKQPDSTPAGTKKCVTFNDNMVTEYSFRGSYGSTSSESSFHPHSPADFAEIPNPSQGGNVGVQSEPNEAVASSGHVERSLLYGVQSMYPYRAAGQTFSATGNRGDLLTNPTVPLYVPYSSTASDMQTEYPIIKTGQTNVH